MAPYLRCALGGGGGMLVPALPQAKKRVRQPHVLLSNALRCRHGAAPLHTRARARLKRSEQA